LPETENSSAIFMRATFAVTCGHLRGELSARRATFIGTMASARLQSRTIGLSLIVLDKLSPESLRRQVYLRLRDAVLGGQLRPGFRLPSTRAVASALGVSRNTVADVFAQLVAEGYLVPRRGSGTYVATLVPAPERTPPRESQTAWERASTRGKLFATMLRSRRSADAAPIPFRPGMPALDLFPFDVWSRIASKVLRRPAPELVGYGDPAGYRPLREVIAAHLRATKGIACNVEQILVVGGSQQALDLICRLTLDPGDEVWVEDPASPALSATYASGGATAIPVRVDAEGMNVERGRALAPRARLAHVTSAHQWPLGVTMSAARRAELLAWAAEADGWIVEDEYDGVFRYGDEAPLPLVAMDRGDRVLWTGSFSVTTFPALRIGYLIAPAKLIDAFVAVKAAADRQTSTLEQAILADFMYDGHYARHLARMQAVYDERQARVRRSVEDFSGMCAGAPRSGLHVILPLDERADDARIAERAAAEGVIAPPLSRYYASDLPRRGLLLGFGLAGPAATDAAARRLARHLPRARTLHRAARDLPG
jgi:GntR family transcriptional regulator/MocR family aminotransferase